MRKELQAEPEVQQSRNAELLPSAPLAANPMCAVRSSSTPKGWNCKCCGKNCDADMKDYYMIKHELWEMAHPKIKGMLCMDCVETKLGRKLQEKDILLCPLTTQINPYTRSILNDC